MTTPGEYDDEGRRIADQLSPYFRPLRRILDILLVGLAVTGLAGLTSLRAFLIAAAARVALPMVFGLIAGRMIARGHHRAG